MINYIKVAMAGAEDTNKKNEAQALIDWASAEFPHLKTSFPAFPLRPGLWPPVGGIDSDGALWLLASQIMAELEAARGAQVIICSRSFLDILAWSRYSQTRTQFDIKENWDWLDMAFDFFERDWSRTYQTIWHLPLPNSALPADQPLINSREFDDHLSDACDLFGLDIPILPWPGPAAAKADLRTLIEAAFPDGKAG